MNSNSSSINNAARPRRSPSLAERVSQQRQRSADAVVPLSVHYASRGQSQPSNPRRAGNGNGKSSGGGTGFGPARASNSVLPRRPDAPAGSFSPGAGAAQEPRQKPKHKVRVVMKAKEAAAYDRPRPTHQKSLSLRIYGF
jgi:hypothetical protein